MYFVICTFTYIYSYYASAVHSIRHKDKFSVLSNHCYNFTSIWFTVGHDFLEHYLLCQMWFIYVEQPKNELI